MPRFSYKALDSKGEESKGVLEVGSQNEAISRIKEMGLYPLNIVEVDKVKEKEPDKGKGKAPAAGKGKAKAKGKKGQINLNLRIPGLGGVKSKVLTTFTRQLATLIDAGLPLLRGLRVLEKQERNATLKRIVDELAVSIEGGSTFSEALAQHPKVFNRLFVNMVKAGELGGVLEVVLNRLAEFMEKAQKIKGKVVAAMFYPVAVLIVAVAILGVLMVLVIPKFREVFEGLGEGRPLPGFTVLVLSISETIKSHFFMTTISVVAVFIVFRLLLKTELGRRLWDKFKLKVPAMGPVISKVAIARFTRTLGTLVSSGVPILQALTIVKETAGNVIVSNAIGAVHESVKEGETITAPLEASGVFPPMVISMVDVGEQTGALPEMLLKIADNYDDEVDNAVSAMTSLLEPIMIVCLAVIVGSIVIAMFLPLIDLMNSLGGS
ncbi:MAG: type II secretion system F family protein [Verrucomicrobia bacterium]|jgi:type IV pilus assembly protein PilC|nr:type II secretion system F family protein [Verrucomicrobiota bacterium]